MISMYFHNDVASLNKTVSSTIIYHSDAIEEDVALYNVPRQLMLFPLNIQAA
jgi:hypothetical protein